MNSRRHQTNSVTHW